MKIKFCWLIILLLFVMQARAQQTIVKGKITHGNEAIGFANVGIKGTTQGAVANNDGAYSLQLPNPGVYTLVISALGYETVFKRVVAKGKETIMLNVSLDVSQTSLNEVTVTGTLKEVSKLNSPVPVEIYTPKFFQKNVSNNLFDALSMVNGVQPTMNCNVCNTGDIHINGMEGPYTLILIDGMPIVSSLSTVYGMMGIPNSMVDRIEVVKGPASTLYGSEAVAGIINVITKNPKKAPLFSFEQFATTYGEYNTDASVKWSNKKVATMLSANYFNFNNRIDKNKDGFTDVTLQNRISVFNKYGFTRKNNKEANVAVRLFYEDRWGGQTEWDKKFRGGDSVYGESIFTKRAELIGNYELPTTHKLKLMYSYNYHNQNSYYGTTAYMATQQVGFAQLVYNKRIGLRHDVLLGTGLRYTYYDDNTPATADVNLNNKPSSIYLPGLFAQDEIALSSTQTILLGARYDYYNQHGSIFSPRVNYKIQPNKFNTLRLSIGNGFRVVNLFTEDHAALTGAREVIIQSSLRPEQSWNGNLNYTRFISKGKGFATLDATAFYTYFTNRIIADYDTDPNKIIYDNLNGYAISRGVSLNADFTFGFPLKLNVGATLMDVFKIEKDSLNTSQKSVQVHAPNFSGTFQLSYTFRKTNLTVDYTGQVYSPMRLPILPNDFRPEYSPWFSLQNVQLTKKLKNNWQVYLGVKNVFNFMPKNPIMRAFDPFDKRINENNPNGYTFDPSYNYAPLQARRVILGVRYVLF